MISKQALIEFKELWEKEKGEPISDELALDEAVNLLSLFNAIYKPLRKGWIDRSEEKYETEQENDYAKPKTETVV